MINPTIRRLGAVYLAKVQISKQITTVDSSLFHRDAMLFTLQRYKFLSKSQLERSSIMLITDVVYLAKVQISKQITTEEIPDPGNRVMLFTLQRYKFLSKSQLAQLRKRNINGAVYLAKVQIMPLGYL